jgi:hypothetical protein
LFSIMPFIRNLGRSHRWVLPGIASHPLVDLPLELQTIYPPVMRPDQLERRLREHLDALRPAV